MKEDCKPAGRQRKEAPKRHRDHLALRNVVSLRISDDELLLLERIRATTSKSASDIMRDAFNLLQRTCAPDVQSSRNSSLLLPTNPTHFNDCN